MVVAGPWALTHQSVFPREKMFFPNGSVFQALAVVELALLRFLNSTNFLVLMLAAVVTSKSIRFHSARSA